MKWFKHFTNASMGEEICEIESIFGMDGYGRWFKLLEIVAIQMDKTDRCSASYSMEKWQTFLKGKQKKLQTFFEHLTKKQLIFVKSNENIIEITIPKLLQYRDNHTSHLQVTSKSLQSKEVEVEVEVEVDKVSSKLTFARDEKKETALEEKNLASASVQKEKSGAKKEKGTAGSDRFCDWWRVYPAKGSRKGNRGDCLAIWERRGLDGDADAIMELLAEESASVGWQKQAGEFIPGAAKWLRAWEAPLVPEKKPEAVPHKYSSEPWYWVYLSARRDCGRDEEAKIIESARSSAFDAGFADSNELHKRSKEGVVLFFQWLHNQYVVQKEAKC